VENDPQSKEVLKGIRILVLDDEEMIRDLVSSSLLRWGAEVDSVANGREGLQLLMEKDFDVLLVDIRMREMDGITFVDEALKIWPWLGVIIMTGYTSGESLGKARRLGVKRLLEKPFTQEILLCTVCDELEEKKVKRKELGSLTLQDTQQQLRILRQLTEPAIKAETLMEALRALSERLSDYLTFAVVGVLGSEGEEYASIINIQQTIAQSFLDEVKADMRKRYAALSGRELPEDIHIELTGKACDSGGPAQVGSTVLVPIITGGEVKGLLILAALEEGAFSTADISFVYHLANHLSAVFLALNRVREMAIHDAMTGLYNRLHIEDEFRQVWERSNRYKDPMAVVIMDIDHFKAINDSYGHAAGDEVLKEFAWLLKETSRTSDIVGRYGGEEFLVILPRGDRVDAAAFGDRLMREVRKHVFCADSLSLMLTNSIGISVWDGNQGPNDAQELLAEADRALYAAKHAGRNCVRMWSRARREQGEDKQPQTKSRTVRRAAGQPQSDAPAKGRVLVVDDDAAIRQMLSVMLRREGYEVFEEERGETALQRIEREVGTMDIVLADLQMPGIGGIELLKKAHSLDESLITIIISGHATVSNAIESLRYGAYDFVQKPFVYRQLSAVMKRALDYRRAMQENKQYQRHLSEMVKEKSAKLRETLEQVKGSYDFTLEALVGLLDAREKDFGQHSKRVRALTVILAKAMGVADRSLANIAHGALLHDIGKIGIPDSVLLKKGPLTAQEWEVMKRHPEIGYRILCNSTYLEEAAEIVYSHQEFFDGAGYPRGLAGEEICLGARIFAVIDAYDAMRSHRTYRAAIDRDSAVAELQRKSGTQFDPTVIAAFMKCRDQVEATFQSLQQHAAEADLPILTSLV
jgi:diguanylate cyclase (GGDEF)-like protein/putative nucleotidyltransferase with HDIG domain